LGPILRPVGQALARYLSTPRAVDIHPATSPAPLLAEALRDGDVLLVEGTSRFSEAIKYLTQSTWSHAALFVGNRIDPPGFAGEPRVLVEADVSEGVRAVSLSLYSGSHTRICRPVGLEPADVDRVCDYMTSRLGYQYDVRNIVDLARYLVQAPPVPTRWRRRMLALGSGDPTRAICSSLIAQAFQSIRYPILPHVASAGCAGPDAEIHQIRHHTLFAPRDFDVSPYFEVIKPRLAAGFDFRELVWDEGEEQSAS